MQLNRCDVAVFIDVVVLADGCGGEPFLTSEVEGVAETEEEKVDDEAFFEDLGDDLVCFEEALGVEDLVAEEDALVGFRADLGLGVDLGLDLTENGVGAFFRRLAARGLKSESESEAGEGEEEGEKELFSSSDDIQAASPLVRRGAEMFCCLREEMARTAVQKKVDG